MKVPYIKYMPLQKFVELGLTPTEMLFVSILVSFSKDDKTLRVGHDNLSEAMGVSPATIKRLIPKLKDMGLISVVSGKAQRNANVYYPSTKLMGLYGQNDLINRVKMTNHTPKGYSKEDPIVSLAKQYGLLKEYMSDLNNFNEIYAEQRLKTRIDIKKNT